MENYYFSTKVISLSYEERNNKTNRDLRLQDKVNKFLYEEIYKSEIKKEFHEVSFNWDMWNATVVYKVYPSEIGV